MAQMEIKKFRQLVSQAIDTLPDEFRNALDNIEVVVEDWPTNEELDFFAEREGRQTDNSDFLLLGLYQGVPLPKRNPLFYSGVLPDKITLFRKSIEEFCQSDERKMIDQIRRTFLHEIGHYFGIEDDKLRRLGY